MKRRIIIILILAAAAAGIYFGLAARRPAIVLTGIVTTDEIVVSSEIEGRLQKLLAAQGDTVTNGQLVALIQPAERKAELEFYTNNAWQTSAQVTQAEADLDFQEAQTSNLISQSEANLSSSKDEVTQAEADLDNAERNFKREEELSKQGVDSPKEFDQARTAYEGARARVDSLRHQAIAAEAAVGLAKATSGQIAARRAALAASRGQHAAATAQADRAQVQLDYTQIRAPGNGIVDVRAALQGEVVNPGQGIVTLIDPSQLWVRADVEETYIDSIRIGDKLPVRLPSGVERRGTVFFRGIDADYATQRDVSRSKRDIKTFEIRLRCDNADRALAVGMTAYVTLAPRAP
ncbi:MAG TPA: efflux RND transporter periplasmic adaptor subunit [Verrucomicrobiae bacterium]|jgi:HlyD family secretion protein